MEPPPRKKTRSDAGGLWVGIGIGALVGLLIGAIVLLVMQISRRETLSTVEPQELTPEVVTANDTLLDRPVVVPTSTQVDTQTAQAPQIVVTSPEQEAVDVANDASVVLNFTVDMDQLSLTKTNVVLYQNGKNISDRTTYSYDQATRSLTVSLQPDKKFAAGSTIELQVGTGAVSSTNIPLAKPYTLRFTIEA